MTAVDVNVGDLLKVGEEEFDSAIKAMTVKNLMSVISGLQREMSREQEAFNSLSGELQKNKGRNSRQYKQISKDMVASQQKLTLLMNRSMKCFAQQNSPITNSSNGGGSDANSSGLRRRNSAKGPIGHAPPSSVGVSSGADSPVAAVSSRTAAISRSKSMHSVNHPGSPSTRPQPSLIASSSSSNSSSNNASKPTSKPLIMHASRPLNNATSSGGSTSTTTLPTSSTNTNANASSSASKPHTPIIMKPSAANGSANLVSSTKTSHPQTSTALTSNNTSAPTRASTSSSLTPHIPTAGSTSTTSVPASNGVSVATTNPLNSDLQGTTNVQGSEGSSRENKQGQGAGTLGGGGTGMYVKRRSGVPSSRPASTSYAVYSSAIASSSQPAPSQIASSSSSFASASLPPRAPAQSRGRLQIVGSTRPATNSNTAGVSPMLLSQPLSKSQGAIHHNHLNLSSEQTPDGNTSSNGTGTAASNDEFRGLPSVRQLAQSFGSMTALNTASSSSSGYTRNPRYVGGGAGRSSSSLVFSPGKGVARSSSSVGFLRGTPSSPSSSSSAFSSSPSASVSTQRLFLTNKGNNANNTNDDSSIKNGSDETQQHDQTSTNLPQQTPFVSKHLNGTAVAQHPPAAQQQEQKQQKQQQQQQRIRPLSVGRAPMSSSSFSIPTSSSSSTSDVESQLALARAKLKNRGSRGITADTAESFVNTAVTAPASESPSASFTSPSPAVSSTSNEISNGQPQSPTDTASSVKLSLVRNNVTGNGSASNVNTDHNSTSASDRTGSATKPTTYSPPLLSSPPPPPKTVNSNNMIYNNNNEDTKTTVSTSNASNNLRRSKSRDELVEQAPASTRLYRQAKKPTSGRETLLQQIQARRRYDDDDDVDGGSSKDNFRAVSKLSMSMPSLLQTGRTVVLLLLFLLLKQ